MRFKIQNWKLTFLACIFFCLFIVLGCWQVSRATQKERLLASFKLRTKLSPLSGIELSNKTDKRFYKVSLKGYFDNKHTFLLDNKTYQGKIGYEVYTPFYATDLKEPILIDRGFVPIGKDRHELPIIQPIPHTLKIVGLVNLPPSYFAFGQITDSPQITWPLRIEYINLSEIKSLLGYSLFPYVLSIDPHHEVALSLTWQPVLMTPERHLGYALQWFAFALTLLILFVILNFDSKKK